MDYNRLNQIVLQIRNKLHIDDGSLWDKAVDATCEEFAVRMAELIEEIHLQHLTDMEQSDA